MRAKKMAALLMASIMTITMLAGCRSDNKGTTTGSGEPATSEGSSKEETASGWTGEISFYAKEYTPRKATQDNPNEITKLQEYATAYEAEHPGVKIKFVELPGDTVMNEYVRTQAAAGTLPDITFIYHGAVGSELPKEMFTPLKSYFDKEDPYVPGTKWGDTFNDNVMQMIQNGNGDYYSICADYVETGIYYNKEMFDKAGITKTPENWEEFMDACKKLKDADLVPMGWSMAQDDTFSTSWTNRIFLSNAYADVMDQIDVDGVKGVSSMEQAAAYKNGVVKVDDGKFLSYFEALKNLVPYLNDSWASKTDLEKKFMQGEVAMYWTGSWLPKKIKDAGIEMSYSSFPFPTPTKNTVPGSTTDEITSGAVGGPSGSFQYSISSEKANKSMTKEKLDVVMDWMMYITEPTRVSEIVNEYGSFCPTIKGSTPAEGMEGLLDNLNASYVIFNGGQELTGTIADTMFRYLHQYMLGEVDMDKTAKDVTKVMTEEVDMAIEDNPDWNIDEYVK